MVFVQQTDTKYTLKQKQNTQCENKNSSLSGAFKIKWITLHLKKKLWLEGATFQAGWCLVDMS